MANLMNLRTDAAGDLAEAMDEYAAGADREAAIQAGERIVLLLHIIAAATLLVDGNPQGFFLNLCRMAENWRRTIENLRARGLEPPPARKNTGLLAALAAGHFQLADALAAASATPIQPEDYEDEHLWATVLQGLAREKPDPAALGPLIDQLEATGPDAEHPCAMARALLSRDAAAFREAFTAARDAYELDTEKRAADPLTPTTAFAPRRSLWLEGLALLRLAERAGMRLDDEEWRFCPPLARVPMTATFQLDWTIPGPPLR